MILVLVDVLDREMEPWWLGREADGCSMVRRR